METKEVPAKKEYNAYQPASPERVSSDYYAGGLNPVKSGQLRMPSWGVVVVLIISFILLKKLIYIIDEKRHDK